MTPPDLVDNLDLERFLNNGAIDLKNLNPLNVISNKRRRLLQQEWTQNTWRGTEQEQKLFAASCGVPLRRTAEDYNASNGAFDVTYLDSFIYVNNRLRTWNYYDVSSSGRTLFGIDHFIYSTRAAPDTILSIFTTPQFTDTTRYVYTFNAANQLILIEESLKFSGGFAPLSRARLIYDVRGNLTRHVAESPNNTNWLTRQDNQYTYNATNQVAEKLDIYVFSSGDIDTTKDTYTYDAQNRLIKLVNTYDGDTTVFTVSNHNAKKRPRVIDINSSDPLFPALVKGTFTYQANDTLLANAVVQEKRLVTNPFVNVSRLIFEYCGDAVATNEVKKEVLDCFVFPNPASASLSIRLKEETASNLDVNVVNMMGQVVLQAHNHAVDTPLSIETLPNGLYVLKVQIGDKMGISSFTVLK